MGREGMVWKVHKVSKVRGSIRSAKKLFDPSILYLLIPGSAFYQEEVHFFGSVHAYYQRFFNISRTTGSGGKSDQ